MVGRGFFMRHIVNVGGGLSSTMELPRRVVERYGRGNVTLIMCRLPNEDPDVWRLCDAISADIGLPINYIGLNLTPWDIFFKVRMMGSSRIDPCSKNLKRDVLDKWIAENCDPRDTLVHVGITHNEIERMIRIRAGYELRGFNIAADLADDETCTRGYLMRQCELRYGFVPRLYRYGFSHNNCGGACVKAGMREWARLLWYLPDVYHWWESNEAKFQREIGTRATILRDRRKGADINLTLRNFRRRCEYAWNGQPKSTMFDKLPRVKALPDNPACMYCTAS